MRYNTKRFVSASPRPLAMNVRRSNKRKWFHMQKRQEADDILQKQWQTTDYADSLELLANTWSKTESLLHSLKQAVGGIGFNLNANKTMCLCFKLNGIISTQNNRPLKLMDRSTYISSTESDVKIRRTKAWTAIDTLSIVWKKKWNEFPLPSRPPPKLPKIQ